MRLRYAAFSLLIVCSISSCRRKATDCGLPPIKDESTPGPSQVRFCATPITSLKPLKVQTLMDASGSMKGFERHSSVIADWTESAFSQLRTATMSYAEQRYCYFSKGRGIHNCSSKKLISGVLSVGDTTLHEAIQSAYEYDLTIILSDGVAATGGGKGDCASGVDAACVARALRNALAPKPGEEPVVNGGIWLLPLIADFDGPLYTELPSPPDFQAQAITDKTTAVFERRVEIRKPRTLAGELVYDYKGPRAYYAFILARDARVGRNLVVALTDAAAARGMNRVSKIGDFRSGFATITPIEVFPGQLPKLVWKGLDKAMQNDAPVEVGTVDVKWAGKPEQPGVLGLGCPGSKPCGDQVQVKASLSAPAKDAACVDVMILPKIAIHRRPGVDGVIDGSEWDPRLQAVRLNISCQADRHSDCASPHPAMEWFGTQSLEQTADSLVSGGDETVAGSIRGMSTAAPALEPHKIYGLLEMLQKFYLEPEAKLPEIPFVGLRWCSLAN